MSESAIYSTPSDSNNLRPCPINIELTIVSIKFANPTTTTNNKTSNIYEI